MRKLKFFPYAFREYLVLVVVISLSVGMLNLNSNSQIRWLQSCVLSIFGTFQQVVCWFSEYSDLRKENEQLRQENIRLAYENSMLKKAYLENIRLRRMLKLQQESKYKLLPASVIGRNYKGFSHAVLLDIGRQNQVKKDLPVICSSGVVGKLAFVGEKFSVVQLIDDINFRISGLVQRSRVVGVVKPGPGNECYLDYVPLHSDVRTGDLVVTSGYSKIFPKGLEIGVVTEVHNPENALFEKIKLQLSANLGKIEEVFIVLQNQ